MSNFTIETEFTLSKKCCICNSIIDEGLIKTNKTKEYYFCPEHGIDEIKRETDVLENKIIRLARMTMSERR